MHNAADENKARDLKNQENNDRIQQIEDIAAILKTAEGVRFFKRLFDEGHLFHSTMTGNSWTFYKEGARDYVLRYLEDVCLAAPEKIKELIIRTDEKPKPVVESDEDE